MLDVGEVDGDEFGNTAKKTIIAFEIASMPTLSKL